MWRQSLLHFTLSQQAPTVFTICSQHRQSLCCPSSGVVAASFKKPAFCSPDVCLMRSPSGVSILVSLILRLSSQSQKCGRMPPPSISEGPREICWPVYALNPVLHHREDLTIHQYHWGLQNMKSLKSPESPYSFLSTKTMPILIFPSGSSLKASLGLDACCALLLVHLRHVPETALVNYNHDGFPLPGRLDNPVRPLCI